MVEAALKTSEKLGEEEKMGKGTFEEEHGTKGSYISYYVKKKSGAKRKGQ